MNDTTSNPSSAEMHDDPPPTPPVRPEDGDCCGQGCIPCIFDFYEDALTQYYQAMAAWRQRHPGVKP